MQHSNSISEKRCPKRTKNQVLKSEPNKMNFRNPNSLKWCYIFN